MKYAIFILLLITYNVSRAQKNVLAADTTIPIPKLNLDSSGNLIITASATSSVNDFDFLLGKWKMYNRRLNKRLENCKDWTEFVSWDEDNKIFDGNANMDTYTTTEMPGLEGKKFEGITMRLFDPNTRLWSLYWIASNKSFIDPPVVGSFENEVGHFFGKDTFNGKPIIFMFRWDIRNKDKPAWGQAFSADNGKTWEWNFFNVLERIK
jgi:hypothetical protein